MTGSHDSSDAHRRPGKNGIDREQTAAIRDLRHEFAEWQKSEVAWRKQDEATHNILIRNVTRQNVLIGVASAVFTAVVTVIVAMWIEIGEVAQRSDAHIYKGEQWGAQLQADIKDNREELRELRRQIQQINRDQRQRKD